jgi:hypothetical protein
MYRISIRMLDCSAESMKGEALIIYKMGED